MPKVKVMVTSALATYMNNERELSIEAETVRDLLAKLAERYGRSFASRILDENGNLRRYINIYVNDRNVRASESETRLSEGDEVFILPAVSGG